VGAEQRITIFERMPASGRTIAAALGVLIVCVSHLSRADELQVRPEQAVWSRSGLGGPAYATFSPSGKTIAVAAGTSVQLVEAGTGKLQREFKGHTRRLHSIAFAPDGKTLATGDGEFKVDHVLGEVRLWDVESGKLFATLDWNGSDVTSLAFTPDGKRVIGGGLKGFRVWQCSTGKLLHEQEIVGGSLAIAVSPDGRTMAGGGFDEVVTLRDAETWREVKVFKGHKSELRSLTFSPDGKTLASGGVGELKVWNMRRGELQRTIRADSTVWGAAFSPDGKRIAIGSGDPRDKALGKSTLWDFATGEVSQSTASREGGIVSVAVSPDGKTFLSGSYGGTVELRKVRASSR
jgi:WD40 repeat protein